VYVVVCKLCKEPVNRKDGNTQGMIQHINRKHEDIKLKLDKKKVSKKKKGRLVGWVYLFNYY
jgi:hypothetical protein